MNASRVSSTIQTTRIGLTPNAETSEGKHLDLWLELFEATARERFPQDAAEAFVVRGCRVADSFEMAICIDK